jgi:peptide/nickel transport system ATP-binding protein
MGDAGLDGLLLLNSTNLVYLSGYPAVERTLARPHYLLVPRQGNPVFLVHEGRAAEARKYGWIDDVRTYHELSVAPLAELGRIFLDLGVRRGRIGCELGFDQRIGIPFGEFAAISDEMVVFYAGEIVESGPTRDLIMRPRHPYTRALLDALPSVERALRPRGISGLPPGRVIVDRCSFAPRCSYAEARCSEEHPALMAVEPDRLVRCVRAGELGPLPSEAAPILQPGRERQGTTILEVEGLVCEYGHGAERVVAVDGVSLEVREREVVGLVGESGSGKSTIGRAITGLLAPCAGTLRWRGEELPLSGRRTHAQHRELQIIFQNPDSSLNPRHTVGQLIGRAVALFRDDVPPRARVDLIADALHEVQLDSALMSRYPHQLSGGQKQRVAMARAFVARPRLVVCDEIISGQDVSVQATILELVRTMQREHETALLFISHDLAAVRSIAQYVYVLQGGRVQEHAATERLFEAPTADYTRRLLAAVLEPGASP